MNLSDGVAVCAHDGGAFVDQYDEQRLADPALLDLIRRTQAYEDAEIEAMGSAFRHAATVAVTTRDGRELSHRILNRRGRPENPISAAHVEYKFRNVARSCLPAGQLNRLGELSRRLDKLPILAELISLATPPRPP